jgi:HEAT repeat protein
MSALRTLILAGAVGPAVLSAQVASTAPVVIRVPDVSWIAPQIAAAQGRMQAGLARLQANAAGLSYATTRIAPAMAQARAGMARAQAALARTLADGWTIDDFEDAPPEPWAQADPADSLYRRARSELNRGRYAGAADLFASIYNKYPRSTYAGDAYYWQAYALHRRGNDESLHRALEVLTQQRKKAPGASTRSDADQLATRICGQLARTGDANCAEWIASAALGAGTPPAAPGAPGMPPAALAPMAPLAPLAPPAIVAGESRGRSGHGRRGPCDDEDDIQSAALNALQQMDAEKAMPILRRVLARRDAGSECLRRRAIFIVSQQEGREAERILLDAARTDPDPEVREQAVQWLSQVDSPGAVAALDSILRSATDPALQEKAIFALSQQDSPKARQALRDFALRPGASDDLRDKAIFWIGQGDDPERLGFLKSLYGQLKSEALREKILFSISQIEGKESSQWLLQVAADVNENIDLRKKALFWVGQSDYPISELTSLYDKMPSREMKEQLIFVYSQRNEKAAVDRLIQIARTETDKELRKKAIFWLSQSDDPRVAEFLASLLEKP